MVRETLGASKSQKSIPDSGVDAWEHAQDPEVKVQLFKHRLLLKSFIYNPIDENTNYYAKTLSTTYVR